ncbi:DUF1508 domain-containing protein [Kriegella sp. EG-1]|nr:DUF1508 domain-containing protein [Flavobacteriaceae bacterium EG-1]
MIFLDKNEFGYTFKIQAESHESLLESKLFSTKEEANQLIEGLKNTSVTHFTFERKTNNNGEFLFNMKDATGNLIGTSQSYNSEAGMQNGIKNLKTILVTLKA